MAYLNLSSHLLIVMLIDLAIAISLLALMRYIQGVVSNVDSKEELSVKDNFAFGISTAGSVIALGIVLTGSITGDAANSYFDEAFGMFFYGSIGTFLIIIGRFIHDRMALDQLDKNTYILKGNQAVAFIDLCAVIATAIIIRSVLLFADGLGIKTFIAIIGVFFISQFMLILVTKIREYTYKKKNNHQFQTALKEGNLALAIREGGYLIAIGLTFTAASHFIEYNSKNLMLTLTSWLIYCIAMLIVLLILLPCIKKIVLYKINITDEVERQQNVGIAAIEMAVSIATSLLLTGLMA